jgi:hypothetical protein
MQAVTRDIRTLYGNNVMLTADFELLKKSMKTDFTSFLTTVTRDERTPENLVAILKDTLSMTSLACFPKFCKQVVDILVPLPLRHMLVMSKSHPLGKRQWSQNLFDNIKREYDLNSCLFMITFRSLSTSD